MAYQSLKDWLKIHPNAILNCEKCGGTMGMELIKNGLKHHVSNCKGKHKIGNNNFAIHSAEAFPANFKFRTP